MSKEDGTYFLRIYYPQRIPLHCQRYKNEDDFFKKNMYKDFPGGPVVKTVFPMQEVLV